MSDKSNLQAFTNVMQPTSAEAAAKLSERNQIDSYEIKGYDLNSGLNYDKLLESYMTTGFQATNFSKAVNEINRMIKCKLGEIPEEKRDTAKTNCTIFLGYTSNMISCGIREYIRFLVQNKMVDCLVCTAGGIEEDFIKCLAPTISGDFNLSGSQLRTDGINRIGNLLVPNDNYCQFEDWIMPIFDQMVDEQEKDGINWTPSKIINRLGKEINNPDSVYYWAYKV
jgi:deoxyhypusine synthase